MFPLLTRRKLVNMQYQDSSAKKGDRPRLAILGAGPIGLEAALHAHREGFDFDIYEADQVGGNLLRWGHVVLFTPFRTNRSEAGAAAIIRAFPDRALPADDAFLTGREFVEKYLQPLAETPELADHIHPNHRVVMVGRSGMLKAEHIASIRRIRAAFRILLEIEGEGERVVEADIVIDATGTYGHHNWLGHGGIPAPGERSATPSTSYTLDDITGKDRSLYEGKHVALIGAGYSAATSVVELAKLCEQDRHTCVVWLTAGDHTPPITEIENDRLFARARLAREANRLASQAGGPIRHVPGVTVERLEVTDRDTVTVHAADRSGKEHIFEVHRVIANVGYLPDRSIYRELQVHECYATFGPIKLAGALLSAPTVDCLDRTPAPTQTLAHPEPNFFILGSKSYGRNSTFLLQTGITQVSQVFSLLTTEQEEVIR